MFVFVCKTIPSFLFPSPFSFFYLFLPLSLSTALPSLFPFLYLCLPLLFLLLSPSFSPYIPLFIFLSFSHFFSLSLPFSSSLSPPLHLSFPLSLSISVGKCLLIFIGSNVRGEVEKKVGCEAVKGLYRVIFVIRMI
uniref:Uncharacterized protein n=1 Tax=Cacopsylla melanoneura TaxID=428564 RepID=A0A8D9F8C0_9HEMI